MLKFTFSKILFFLFPLSLWGYIESFSIIDIESYADTKTLIVFDIDDTLIRYPSHLGSTAWFDENYQTLSLEDFHKISGLLAQEIGVVAVERGAGDLISKIQKRGVYVMGMTRRFLYHPGCPNWPKVTASQVESIGVHFNPPNRKGLIGGILITDGKDKGEALLHYLQHLKRPLKKILFIDDRKGECESVEKSLAPHFEVTTLWYRYQERFGPSYDSNQASDELRELLNSELKLDLVAQDKNPRKVDEK